MTTRYTIRRRILAIGRDYTVLDPEGRSAFRVDGKLRFATTFDVIPSDGAARVRVREKLLSIEPTFRLLRDGREAGRVRRTSTDVAPYVFAVELAGAEPMRGAGSFFANEAVELKRGDARLARLQLVPNEAIRETFLLDLARVPDEALLVAVAICFVEMIGYRGEVLDHP
jgi:uncharacterized protein YxjI